MINRVVPARMRTECASRGCPHVGTATSLTDYRRYLCPRRVSRPADRTSRTTCVDAKPKRMQRRRQHQLRWPCLEADSPAWVGVSV